jgi:hypothetical protein
VSGLDHDLLARVGLGDLPDDVKASLLRTLADELETRVGTAIAARLTESQLAEFERLIEAGCDVEARQLLHDAVPGYHFIATSQQVILEMKLAAEASQIRASFAAD